MQAVHKEKFKEYEAEKIAQPNKRPSTFLSTDVEYPPKRQRTFEQMFNKKQPSAEAVKSLIFNYIVDEMKPLRTVESISFKRLCTGLCPSAVVMTRSTLAKLVTARYEEMVQTVTSALGEVDVVCTTADLWSSQSCSFLGMTVHWL